MKKIDLNNKTQLTNKINKLLIIVIIIYKRHNNKII